MVYFSLILQFGLILVSEVLGIRLSVSTEKVVLSPEVIVRLSYTREDVSVFEQPAIKRQLIIQMINLLHLQENISYAFQTKQAVQESETLELDFNL